MRSIGIVGCGAIGKAILRAADTGVLDLEVAGVASRTEDTAREFLAGLDNPQPIMSTGELIEACDMVVEAAGAPVVPGLATATFDAGKDLMLISVGALIAHPEILDRSRETGCRLLMPSGAIVGLDGIKSATMGVNNNLDLWAMTEETEIFSGSAREACVGFPANLNVSAAVSFAGIGPDRTTVKMVLVPELARNCHDIEVEGEFGLLRIHLENIPGENPKTGRLTAMSIIRTLQQSLDPVHIGT